MKRSNTAFSITMAAVALALAASLGSCSPTQGMYRDPVYLGRQPGTTTVGTPRQPLPSSVEIPADGTSPRTGGPARSKARTATFNSIGQRIEVKNGETVNLIYDGIDPESAYLRYESTVDGYALELAQRNQFVVVNFERLCQMFIVDSPGNAAVSVADDLRLEQVIWTPREDGSWEVRIGSVNRGCQSEALDNLNRLRSGEYERGVPREGKRR